MSTYILNPNDTIVMSDSIVVKMTKAADACLMFVNETATNCNDVMIVSVICVAIVLVALIAKQALSSWKKAESDYQEKEFLNKQKKDEAESLRKQKADLMGKKLETLKKMLDKNMEIEDSLRKQKTDLLEEKLELLKKLCNGNVEAKEKKNECFEIEKHFADIIKELNSIKEHSQTLTQKYFEAIDEELKYYKECSQTQKKGKTVANENE